MTTCEDCDKEYSTEKGLAIHYAFVHSQDPVCAKCRVPLTEANWTPRNRRRHNRRCTSCEREYAKSWRAANNDWRAQYNRRDYMRRRESQLARHRAYAQRIRAEVIEAYGGRCRCCGETEPMFLTIDHVYGNGSQERRQLSTQKIGTGSCFYRWLQTHGYPQEGYQLLCFNCNRGKSQSRECPHRRHLYSLLAAAVA